MPARKNPANPTPTYLLDHVHKFGLRRILAKGAHDSAKFLRSDST